VFGESGVIYGPSVEIRLLEMSVTAPARHRLHGEILADAPLSLGPEMSGRREFVEMDHGGSRKANWRREDLPFVVEFRTPVPVSWSRGDEGSDLLGRRGRALEVRFHGERSPLCQARVRR